MKDWFFSLKGADAGIFNFANSLNLVLGVLTPISLAGFLWGQPRVVNPVGG